MYINDYQNVMGAIAVVFGIIAAFVFAIGVVMYIFQGIGLYSISKRRRLGTSAFAWIPILNWIKIGQIADDAVLHKRGTGTHFRILLPVFEIVSVVLSGVGTFLVSISFNLNDPMFWNGVFSGNPRTFETAFSPGSLTAGFIILAVGYLLAIIVSVMCYICYYHIFKSCSTGFVAFFVLSLIFPVTVPFFFFALRKKDNPAFYHEEIPDPAEAGI